MNGSRCVIFTFPGSSPPVFHYNNSPARSDKTGDVAIRHDNFPQPERSTLSCALSFHMLFSREDNRRAKEKEKTITCAGRKDFSERMKTAALSHFSLTNANTYEVQTKLSLGWKPFVLLFSSNLRSCFYNMTGGPEVTR